MLYGGPRRSLFSDAADRCLRLLVGFEKDSTYLPRLRSSFFSLVFLGKKGGAKEKRMEGKREKRRERLLADQDHYNDSLRATRRASGSIRHNAEGLHAIAQARRRRFARGWVIVLPRTEADFHPRKWLVSRNRREWRSISVVATVEFDHRIPVPIRLYCTK